MAALKLCKTCGVPLRIGKDHVWNPDGTMTQRRDPDHRMIFFDSDGVGALFSNIERLIGVPIENIVIESKARATCAYISHLIRGLRGTAARMVGIDRVVARVVNQGRVMGYGDINMQEVNWKDMFMTCRIAHPYALPLFCGDLRGATEAIRKMEGNVTHEEVAPDTFLVRAFHEEHAAHLEQRLMPRQLHRKPGNISFTSCPGCGVPMEISKFKWDLDEGTIVHEPTGLRYAIFGPAGLQAIFDELENELGETIPETIVEAQRLHSEERLGGSWKNMGVDDLRGWLASQGMGSLVSTDQVEGGIQATVQNPAVPLVLVGTAAAFFEFMVGARASLSWSIADDGDLVFTLKRRI